MRDPSYMYTITTDLNSQVMYETILHSVLAMNMGQALTERMKHTQARSHDAKDLLRLQT